MKRLEEEMNLFFKELSESPLYKRFVDDGCNIVGKYSLAVGSRVQAFRNYFREKIESLLSKEIPFETEAKIRKMPFLVDEHIKNYMPEYYELYN